jgi:hypothetical protein
MMWSARSAFLMPQLFEPISEPGDGIGQSAIGSGPNSIRLPIAYRPLPVSNAVVSLLQAIRAMIVIAARRGQ